MSREDRVLTAKLKEFRKSLQAPCPDSCRSEEERIRYKFYLAGTIAGIELAQMLHNFYRNKTRRVCENHKST